MSQFIRSIISWLETAIEKGIKNSESFMQTYKLTEQGDIFTGENDGKIANGKGF